MAFINSISSTIVCMIVVGAQSVQGVTTMEKAQAMFYAGLAGDALALGGHYEYDAKKIKETVGSYDDFKAPGEGMGGTTHGVGWGRHNYHPGKGAGDLSDAGEVAIMLLEHLVAAKGHYNFDGYAAHWLDRIISGYGSCNFQQVGEDGKCPQGTQPGYLNGGTRRTLQALGQNRNAKGEARKRLASNVNCLVSATHFGPLLFAPIPEQALVDQAASTVYLSHSSPDPVNAARFLSRAIWRILHKGLGVEAALEGAAEAEGSGFITDKLAVARAKVAEARDPARPLSKEAFVDDLAITSMTRLWDVGKTEPIKVGKASPTEGALPSALYFILKYQDNLEQALIANANVGGDSCARGIVIGMVLGAQHGIEGIPKRWLDNLNDLPRVRQLYQSLADVYGMPHTEL